jgi:hypothetical protein
VNAGTDIGVAVATHRTQRVSVRDGGFWQVSQASPQVNEERLRGLFVVSVAAQDIDELGLGV